MLRTPWRSKVVVLHKRERRVLLVVGRTQEVNWDDLVRFPGTHELCCKEHKERCGVRRCRLQVCSDPHLHGMHPFCSSRAGPFQSWRQSSVVILHDYLWPQNAKSYSVVFPGTHALLLKIADKQPPHHQVVQGQIPPLTFCWIPFPLSVESCVARVSRALLIKVHLTYQMTILLKESRESQVALQVIFEKY